MRLQMRAATRFVMLIVASATGAGVQASDAGRPMNVLFIAVDDLNDWIGMLDGYRGVHTPNLDRLAKRGMLFERAYCAAPACNPSRVSLLIGRRPSSTGVYHNPQPFRPVLPDAVTLPQHFKRHGYQVVGGGKIFHGSYPDPQSWDDYFKQQPDPAPSSRPVNGIPNAAHFDWGPLDVPDSQMGDAKVVQWTAEFLGRKHDKPFFLGVGIFRPHLPWYVPKSYFDIYRLEDIVLPRVQPDDLDDVPAMGVRIARPDGDHARVIEAGQWTQAVQGYLASISFADACLGRVLDALDASSYADNTIIVLWGDHGWHLGEKLHWRKFSLWEEAARVPLMLAAPGVTKGNERCGRTVSLLDIYPTLVELCGLPKRAELEGESVLPLLKNPSAEWDRPAITTHGRNNHAVRTERWRYIRYEDGGEELYDHEKDPMEWTNLASRDDCAEIKKDLARWLPKVNAPNAPVDQARDRAGRSNAKKR